MAGTIQGREYNRVVWRKKRCQCGQLLMVRTYEKEAAEVGASA
jgi:hypothetical protein